LQFEQGVIDTERQYDSTLKRSAINYYDLKAFIASPETEVVVAEQNGEIIGSGYARIKEAEAFLQHTHYAHLGFMYVKPDHRGKGVNSKIITALKQWAISKNITEIRLEVYENNTNARKAYEKAGFAGHLLLMRMGIGE
ncbi:MAG: GNAT family N-acetyltransferase, partial [Chitinophagaceae bacterium]|nr:GNAT family N-acetyltransferase [Chitinophagaceae bacterium]